MSYMPCEAVPLLMSCSSTVNNLDNDTYCVSRKFTHDTKIRGKNNGEVRERLRVSAALKAIYLPKGMQLTNDTIRLEARRFNFSPCTICRKDDEEEEDDDDNIAVRSKGQRYELRDPLEIKGLLEINQPKPLKSQLRKPNLQESKCLIQGHTTQIVSNLELLTQALDSRQ